MQVYVSYKNKKQRKIVQICNDFILNSTYMRFSMKINFHINNINVIKHLIILISLIKKIVIETIFIGGDGWGDYSSHMCVWLHVRAFLLWQSYRLGASISFDYFVKSIQASWLCH